MADPFPSTQLWKSIADQPSLDALYTHSSSLSSKEVPATKLSASVGVSKGFDGGEFVIPEIQFPMASSLVEEMVEGVDEGGTKNPIDK